jgi:hypothetical protein
MITTTSTHGAQNMTSTSARGIDAIRIISAREQTSGELAVLVTSCLDHDDFQALPRAVEYRGRVFGLTGWNSDRHVAYYRCDAAVAMVVR